MKELGAVNYQGKAQVNDNTNIITNCGERYGEVTKETKKSEKEVTFYAPGENPCEGLYILCVQEEVLHFI